MARVRRRGERRALSAEGEPGERSYSKGLLATYLKARAPERSVASGALRTVFAGMFLAQSLVAAVVAAAFVVVGSPVGAGASALGPVLAVLAPVQCLLGVLLPDRLARSGSKESALSSILLAGVLLATPVWFFVLALVTGQDSLPVTVLAVTVVAAYSLGFVVAGRLGARVAAASRAAASRAAAEQAAAEQGEASEPGEPASDGHAEP